MDYLADLPVKESCSILEQTTPTKNGGTASCRSAVFFGSEEEEWRGEEGHGNRRRRIGEDFERKKEESGRTGTGLRRSGTGIGEEWNGTLKRKKKGL